jgi:hypothetical protein
MIDKTAQERGLYHKLREKTNITGKILESLNPEFSAMLDRLRAADEKVREYAQDTKPAIRSINSFVRQRDYLSAATQMAAFHERCRYLVAELERFKKSVNLKHYQFLLDQFDDTSKEQLFGYNPDAELKLDEGAVDDLTATAGLKDMWFKFTDPLEDTISNLTKKKNVAMRALEKRFSISFLKDLKKDSIAMAERSTRFASIMLTTLKRLAAARAIRHVDDYIKLSDDLIRRFNEYHKMFIAYYNKDIVPLKQQHEEILAQKKREDEAKETERARPGLEQQQQMLQALEVEDQKKQQALPNRAEQMKQIEMQRKKTLEGLDSIHEPENEPIDLVNIKNEPINIPNINADFIAKIEKAATEHNAQALVVEILNASAALEDTNSQESLKLLAIAEGIIEDYKTAGILDMLRGKKPEAEVKKEPTPPLV